MIERPAADEHARSQVRGSRGAERSATARSATAPAAGALGRETAAVPFCAQRIPTYPGTGSGIETAADQPGGFFFRFFLGKFTMSLSSAKNYALRAERSQDAKEAADLLAKAILELAAAIEATDAKVKKMNKSG